MPATIVMISTAPITKVRRLEPLTTGEYMSCGMPAKSKMTPTDPTTDSTHWADEYRVVMLRELRAILLVGLAGLVDVGVSSVKSS